MTLEQRLERAQRPRPAVEDARTVPRCHSMNPVQRARCHLSLHCNAPAPREVKSGTGRVRAIAHLGGLHHRYTRAAGSAAPSGSRSTESRSCGAQARLTRPMPPYAMLSRATGFRCAQFCATVTVEA